MLRETLRTRASGIALATLAVLAVTGCAKRTKGRSRATMLASLSGPHFAYGKATLTPEGRAKVQTAAAALGKYRGRRIVVSGFTDAMGEEAYNYRLSERRAEAVAQALIEDGIAAGWISTRAYGESNPVASNSTAEGRAQNRRVEIGVE